MQACANIKEFVVNALTNLIKCAAVFLIVTMVSMLAACGSGSSDSLTKAPDLTPGQIVMPAAQLPALSDLPEPDRAARIAGPGWFQVPILEQGVLSARGGSGTVNSGPNGKNFTTAGDSTYAIFGVYGFDGDMQPNAVMAETLDLSGNYYVGVSHYADNRWEFAGPFNADEQYEYRHAGPFSDASQYISDKSYHYIAIVLEDGGSMTLSSLQLGVDGGDNAPLAAPYFEVSLGDIGITLYWNPSPSHHSPDFAGYAVERAAWPSTDYTEVRPLSQDLYFLDTDVSPLAKFRYRIRVEDVSGNTAYGFSGIAFQFAGDSHPVPVLNIPAGPLYGAQTVTFDMSDSFDPDGDPIDEYRLSFSYGPAGTGLLPVVTTDDSVDVELQPGCYSIRLQVTANGLFTWIDWQLKVYPAWNPEISLISSPDKGDWRMQRPRSIYWPEGDAVVTLYDDLLAPGIGALVQHADGSSERFQLPYRYNELDFISEPVIWNGKVYFAVNENQSFDVFYVDNSGLHRDNSYLGGSNYEQVDLVVSYDNTLRMCYLEEFNPGEWRIMAADTASYGSAVKVMPLSNSEGWFDVEWNSVLGTFDVIYTTVGSIHWLRTDEEGGILDSQFLAAGIFDFLEMEIDPVDGTPHVLALSGGLYTYYQFDNDTSTWSGVEGIDGAGFGKEVADMIIVNSNPTVFFGKVLGQSNLYRRNGGSWDATVVDWALLSGFHCTLAQWPDGVVNIIDGAAGGFSFIVNMQPDGSHASPVEVNSTSYMGQDLNAVAGNSGIHAYWRGDGAGYHFIADPDGSNWTVAANLGATDGIEMMADAQGDVYVSHTVGNFCELRSWFGGAWLIEAGWFRWGQHLPFLAAQNNAKGAQWKVHDNTVAPAQVRYMHDDNDVVIVADSYDLAAPQIMEGVSLWTNNGLLSFVSTGIGGSDVGRVGYLADDNTEFNLLFDGSTAYESGDWTRGRQLDAATYLQSNSQLRSVLWAGYLGGGAGGAGQSRVTGYFSSGNFDVNELTFAEPAYDSNAAGNLFTVSAAQAWGNTAVGISDQFMGDVATLEWSNFGDFEQLNLPPLDMLNSSMHELVVGVDGRWHILYRDQRDGGIYVISTT